MKTLDEHNAEKEKQHIESLANQDRTGVLCPKCGMEMRYTNPRQRTASIPPMDVVTCPQCKYLGYMKG